MVGGSKQGRGSHSAKFRVTTVRRVATTPATQPVRDYIIQRRLWRTPTRRELSDAVGTSQVEAPTKRP